MKLNSDIHNKFTLDTYTFKKNTKHITKTNQQTMSGLYIILPEFSRYVVVYFIRFYYYFFRITMATVNFYTFLIFNASFPHLALPAVIRISILINH